MFSTVSHFFTKLVIISYFDLDFTAPDFFIFWILHLQCMLYINLYEKYFAFYTLVLLNTKNFISIKFC